MKIKWPNVFALVLIAAALMVFLKFGSQLIATVSMVQSIGPGHSTQDQTIGLLVLGLMAVAIVAVTRILASQRWDK